MTQTQQILKYLQSGNKITGMDALQLFGCFRLAARVQELREIGYEVKSQLIKINGKRIAEYWL
jgi:biotin operon repressor